MASARKGPVYQEAMLAEGAQAYFTKPIDLPKFRVTVARLLAA